MHVADLLLFMCVCVFVCDGNRPTHTQASFTCPKYLNAFLLATF